MPTLDEQFEQWLEQEQRPVDERYRSGPHYQQRLKDFLAGATAEREAALAIIGQYQGENAFSDHELNHDEEIETETTVGTCQDLIDRIRQRGEAGERPEEEK